MITRDSCAHPTGLVKSNSSEIEASSMASSISLVLTSSRSSVNLDIGAVDIESTLAWIGSDRQVINATG